MKLTLGFLQVLPVPSSLVSQLRPSLKKIFPMSPDTRLGEVS